MPSLVALHCTHTHTKNSAHSPTEISHSDFFSQNAIQKLKSLTWVFFSIFSFRMPFNNCNLYHSDLILLQDTHSITNWNIYHLDLILLQNTHSTTEIFSHSALCFFLGFQNTIIPQTKITHSDFIFSHNTMSVLSLQEIWMLWKNHVRHKCQHFLHRVQSLVRSHSCHELIRLASNRHSGNPLRM